MFDAGCQEGAGSVLDVQRARGGNVAGEIRQSMLDATEAIEAVEAQDLLWIEA